MNEKKPLIHIGAEELKRAKPKPISEHPKEQGYSSLT